MTSGHMETFARVSVDDGWLVLTEGPYSLADGTLEKLDSKMRSIVASNELVAGEYTVVAVEGNDAFPFNVRVKTDSQAETWAAIVALRRAIQRRNFILETTMGDWEMSWTCQATDVSIDSQKALMHATQAVVSTTMSALPQEA